MNNNIFPYQGSIRGPLLLVSLLLAAPCLAATNSTHLNYVKQGAKWNDNERHGYYSQDQGSQIMPLKWFQTLKQTNGELFLADGLQRYGYLANDASPTPGLPVGFTVNDKQVGMTCSACHVREIKVDDQFYRIDGGPAIVDFQTFATELGDAVKQVLNDPKQFSDFAVGVLGNNAASEQQAKLRKDVEAWYLPYSTIMDNALPKDKPWGPARLDAVGMIFNRLTGLDIGLSADHIIAKNIHRADAPVRYPFLWNAHIQDKTQWPGFAANGNDLLALGRNLGEVIGVFAHFYPVKDDFKVLGVDFLQTNSANFKGLEAQEQHLKKIGPPEWPWLQGPYQIDQKLADKGEKIFNSTTQTEAGGCIGCHGIRKGAMRSHEETWATPLCNVGTDTREFNLLKWTVDTGQMAGAQIPVLDKPLQAQNELAFNVLTFAVIGSILQHDTSPVVNFENEIKKDVVKLEGMLGADKAAKMQSMLSTIRQKQSELITQNNSVLQDAFQKINSNWKNTGNKDAICKEDFKNPQPAIAFESRVLNGIWATAPYMHNGAIPTLTDMLKPVAERPTAFKIGQAYDPLKIGLATEQTQFNYTYQTTDCSIPDSGNSHCGHEFGTRLSEQDKKALLEYLKRL